MRVPLSTLYITFEKSDRFGYCLAWVSALPYFILFFMAVMVVLYLVHIFISHEMAKNVKKTSMPANGVVIWFWHEEDPYAFVRWLGSTLLGQICCETLALLLKGILKGERPLSSDRHGHDFGNPSSHTQFIAFFAYICLRRLHSQRKETPLLVNALGTILLVGLVPLVAFSRLYLQYHYLYQVCSGFGVGLLFAICWDYFVTLFFLHTKYPM